MQGYSRHYQMLECILFEFDRKDRITMDVMWKREYGSTFTVFSLSYQQNNQSVQNSLVTAELRIVTARRQKQNGDLRRIS